MLRSAEICWDLLRSAEDLSGAAEAEEETPAAATSSGSASASAAAEATTAEEAADACALEYGVSVGANTPIV